MEKNAFDYAVDLKIRDKYWRMRTYSTTTSPIATGARYFKFYV